MFIFCMLICNLICNGKDRLLTKFKKVKIKETLQKDSHFQSPINFWNITIPKVKANELKVEVRYNDSSRNLKNGSVKFLFAPKMKSYKYFSDFRLPHKTRGPIEYSNDGKYNDFNSGFYNGLVSDIYKFYIR